MESMKVWQEERIPPEARFFTQAFKSTAVLSLYHQFSSVTQSCLTLQHPMDHSTPGLPVHHQLLEFTQTHLHWVSDAIQPSHPLSSLSPPAFNPSQHQGFSNESALRIRWPKHWSFSFNNSPANEYSGLISGLLPFFKRTPSDQLNELS